MRATERSHPAPASGGPLGGRIASLDAVRGFAIVVMFIVANPGTVRDMPAQLKHHAGSSGYTFADSIFPLFLFAVGTALLFSSKRDDARKVARRVAILFALGVALSSMRAGALVISWGVLQRIAIAYLLAWLILRGSPRRWFAISAATVGGAMVLFVALPPEDARAFWSLGAGMVDAGRVRIGFSMLATVGTLLAAVHVVGGAVAGRYLKERGGDPRVLIALTGWALGCVALGVLLGAFVPVTQRLWTPSFTVLSLGTAFAYLAVMHAVTLLPGTRPLTWILIVPGANAIAAYVASFGMRDLVLQDHLRPLVVPGLDAVGGPTFAAVAYALAIAIGWWLFCLVLYRREVFLRI